MTSQVNFVHQDLKRFFAACLSGSFCAVQMMVSAPPAQAQSRALPRANFSTYGGSGGELPSGGGLHLHEGQDRRTGSVGAPYDPRDPDMGGKLMRWESRHFPLKVWISPGLQLPVEPLAEITKHRPTEVLMMLQQNPGALVSLPQAKRWKPEMSQAAANGIEQWRELASEGVINFEFVNEPWGANILVFWVDNFVDASGPGGSSVHGNTCTQAVDVGTVRAREAQLGQGAKSAPVIIEMAANEELDRLQAETCHEFGHALGIKAHSPYRQDIMYVHRIVPLLSDADKATLRWLYKQPPQFVFLPPPVPDVSAIARRPQSTGPVQASGEAESPGGEQSSSSYRIGGSGGYRIGGGSASPGEEAPAPETTSGSSVINGGGRYKSPSLGDSGSGGGEVVREYKKPDDGEGQVRRVKNDDEPKPEKEKKKKRKKDDDAAATTTTPVPDENPDPVRPARVTDGF